MSALLQPEAYRNLLRRVVAGDLVRQLRGVVLWLLLNPSKAERDNPTGDPKKDDQTTRKVLEQTARWGYGELIIANQYAYRATKPAELWMQLAAGVDVVGPENDDTIIKAAERADIIVCGWGRLPSQASGRTDAVLEKLWAKSKHQQLFCMGRNGDSSPVHPCFAPYVTEPMPWRRRKVAA